MISNASYNAFLYELFQLSKKCLRFVCTHIFKCIALRLRLILKKVLILNYSMECFMDLYNLNEISIVPMLLASSLPMLSVPEHSLGTQET